MQLQSNPRRLVHLFLLGHLVTWTLVPTVLNANLPLDVVEGLLWGHEWAWGYNKHPPLSAWLMEAFATVFARHDLGQYLLAQVCIVGAFWLVWRLAVEFVPRPSALVAVLLLEGISYHNLTSPEFNVNIILLLCWTLTIVLYWKAIHSRRLVPWVGLGLAVGAGILSKYLIVFLVLPLTVHFLSDPRRWRLLRRAHPHVMLAAALLVVAPHLLWMLHNDFITIEYGLRRSAVAGVATWLDHVRNPIAFLAAQGLSVLPCVLLFLCLGRPRRRTPTASREQASFLVAAGLGPLLTFLGYAAVTGAELQTMWGTPLFTFLGLLLVFFFAPEPPAWNTARFRVAFLVVAVLPVALYIAAYGIGPLLKGKGKRTQFPGRELAAQVTSQWRAHTASPLRVVVGDEWHAGNVAWYSADRPSVSLEGDERTSPWLDERAIARSGAVVVWPATREGAPGWVEALSRRHPGLAVQSPLRLGWHSWTALPEVTVSWAMIPPLATSSIALP